tara:strand:- start:3310 stop:4119 length:810 start_codon:yes stop_codon:yes gene_type:complete
MSRKYDIYTLNLTDNLYIQRNVASGSVFVPSLNDEYNFEFNVVVITKDVNSKTRFEKNFEPFSPNKKELDTLFNDIKPFLNDTDNNQVAVYMTATDKNGNRCSHFVTMMFRYAMSLSYGSRGYDPSFYNSIRNLITDSIDLNIIKATAYKDFFNFQESFITHLEMFFHDYTNKYHSQPNKNQIKDLFKPCQSILDININNIEEHCLKIFFSDVIFSFEDFLKDQKLAIVCQKCGTLTSYSPTKIACSDKCRKSLQNKRQYQKSLYNYFK